MDPTALMAKYDDVAQQLMTDFRRLGESNLGELQEPFQRTFRAVVDLIDEIAAVKRVSG